VTLSAPAASETGAPPRARRQRPGFVEKTLAGITTSIETAIFSEESARRDGFLQRRDPRVKVAAFVALILAAGLSRDWLVLGVLYAVVLGAASVSAISLRSFLKRVWLGIPLFSGIVVLPSIFIVHGHPLFDVPLGFATLTASRDGLFAAGIFVLRVAVSVSLAILLVLTTRWADVLKALQFYRMPNIFVLILAMTYRYIFLFLHTVSGMFLARKSRVVAKTTGREQRWWVVSSMGVLMSRSFRMSDDVYQAMLARGFSNRFRTLTEFHMRPADWVFGLAAAILAGASISAGWWLR
jgi:cobalt/nickel transport system permease protein